MKLSFAYSKIYKKGRAFVPGTAITTYVESESFQIQPLGDAGTAAPSTMVIDPKSDTSWFLNKPFSAVHAALSAATPASSVSLI
jgi:hypothetical protein